MSKAIRLVRGRHHQFPYIWIAGTSDLAEIELAETPCIRVSLFRDTGRVSAHVFLAHRDETIYDIGEEGSRTFGEAVADLIRALDAAP